MRRGRRGSEQERQGGSGGKRERGEQQGVEVVRRGCCGGEERAARARAHLSSLAHLQLRHLSSQLLLPPRRVLYLSIQLPQPPPESLHLPLNRGRVRGNQGISGGLLMRKLDQVPL